MCEKSQRSTLQMRLHRYRDRPSRPFKELCYRILKVWVRTFSALRKTRDNTVALSGDERLMKFRTCLRLSDSGLQVQLVQGGS